MALKPIVGEIKSQDLNDNFSYLDERIVEGGTDPQLEADVATLAGGSMVAKADRSAFNAHLAEKVAFAGSFSRDASIAGVQNIRGLGFMPKSVLFIATVNGQQNKHAFGFIAENGQQRTLLTIQSGAKYVESGRVMNLMDDSSNNTIGIASLVEDGFDITWEHRGAGATGTISVMYLAHSHGGGAS